MKARTTVTGALVERDAPRRFTLAGRYTESHYKRRTRNNLAIPLQ